MDVRLDAGAVGPRGQRPAWPDAAHGMVWSCAAHRRAGDPWVCRQREAFSLFLRSWEGASLNHGALLWVTGQMQWMFVRRQAEKKRPMGCWSRQKDTQFLQEKRLVRWWWSRTAQAEFWLCHFQVVHKLAFFCVCASSPQVTVMVLTRERLRPAQAHESQLLNYQDCCELVVKKKKSHY